MCEELSGIDLGALGEQTEAFLARQRGGLRGSSVEPHLRDAARLRLRARCAAPTCPRSSARRRSTATIGAGRLVPSLAETLAGLGIDVHAQQSVTLDVEQRPKKSPRAFCAPVRVPDEVYLVIAPIGGRDDFAALFHEAGHTEHYAHVDARAAGGGARCSATTR